MVASMMLSCRSTVVLQLQELVQEQPAAQWVQ
jgi:hypothetical protein